MDEKEMAIMNDAAKVGFAAEKAERSLIGSLITRFSDCSHIIAELSDEDFFYDAHRIAFKAVKKAKEDNLTVDLISIEQEIKKINPDLADNVMQQVVVCLSDAEPWAVASRCKIIKELSARRKALALLGQITEDLKNPASDINGTLDELRTSSSEILTGGHTWSGMGSVLMNTYDYLSERATGKIKSINSGVANLDSVIGGFFGGELTVIGARPAVGKSVFGMNVALAAATQGYKVGILSREMTDIQYGQRIFSYFSGVDGMKIRKAKLEEEDWRLLAESLGRAGNLPVEFMFTVRTVDDLRAEVQKKHNRKEIDMLVVDYLQLMGTTNEYREDRLRVGAISKGLKDIATDFNIPVIALAQVKRFAGGARARMPTLEDLKDSGSIEQDADNVIFLHNPFDEEDEFVDPRDKEYFKGYVNQGWTYLCIGVAKQRQGVTGVCCCLFDKQKMRYSAIER